MHLADGVSGSYYYIVPYPWLSSEIYQDQQEKYG